MLAQELGVEPGAETQALRDAIGQGVEHRTVVKPMPVAESQTGVVLAIAGAGPGMVQDVQLSQFQGQALSSSNELLLVRFPDEEQAVAYAVELLAVSAGSVRIGIHQGEFIHETKGLTGDAVSVAMRLLALAETGSVCVSERVRTATEHSVRGEYQFIGEHRARDVEQPFLAFRLPKPGQLGAGAAPHCALAKELPLPGKPSIIIKPFVSMSAEGDQDYFAEGLTKDISIALTKIPGLFLAEDATPKAHMAVSMNPTDLGRAFGVRYVLGGGVRKAGKRVRVNAELIDVTTSQCVWGERYDCELHDLFEIQDEITEEIVTAMDIKLVQGEAARFMRKALTNPSALEASYRGWYALYHGTGKQDVFEAQRLFDEVVRLQPESPLGYASAALAYWAEAGFGRIRLNSPPMAHAVELAHKALELGDTTGYAHLVLAVEHLAQHHYDQAMAQATEGVAARPNCNGAYAIKSMVLNFLGQPQAAIEFAKYAVRLTPFYPAEYPAVLAASYHDSDRFEEAVAAAEASLQLKKNDVDPMLFLAASLVALGDMNRASTVAQDILRLDPGFHINEFAETQPYKNRDDLDRLIGRLRACGLPE